MTIAAGWEGNSLGGHLPDPVALGDVHVPFFLLLEPRKLAAVVGFVPADGVENEPAIGISAVTKRLAVDDIIWEGVNENRNERVEPIWRRSVGEAAAFEGASDPR